MDTSPLFTTLNEAELTTLPIVQIVLTAFLNVNVVLPCLALGRRLLHMLKPADVRIL